MDKPNHTKRRFKTWLEMILGDIAGSWTMASWIRLAIYSILVVLYFFTGAGDLKAGTTCSGVTSVFLNEAGTISGVFYLSIMLVPMFEMVRILHKVAIEPTPTMRFIAIGVFVFTVILCYSVIYMWLGISAPDGIVAANPFDYVYYSTVTFTTLGYGDFTPCPNARWAAASQAMIGFGSVGLLVYVATKRD